VSRVVADLGNSRLKWGRLDGRGRLAEAVALGLDDPESWAQTWRRWGAPEGSSWAVATVNPPAAGRLAAFLDARVSDPSAVRWYRSAADVSVRHRLERPETAGADRAFAVAAAVAAQPAGRPGPGMVVLCGTAVTVECVAADGTWQGGAIAAGLGLTARALHLLTAQLPPVEPSTDPPPPAWGNATVPALEAGVFWGVVGAIRELLTRQAAGLSGAGPPWVVWTGGDAEPLARAVAWPGSRVVADLVLHGLAGVAFGTAGG
jgi:type III pantothenate kinase